MSTQGVKLYNADGLSLDVNLSGATFYPTAADAAAASNAITFPVVITATEDYFLAEAAGDRAITVSAKHKGRELAGVDGTGETIIIYNGIMAQIGVNYDSTGSAAKAAEGGHQRHVVATVAAAGATETLVDPDTADLQYLTLDANCTLTFPSGAAGDSFWLFLKQDATGSRLITWPTNIVWPGAAEPTLETDAAAIDVFHFIYAASKWHCVGRETNLTDPA